MIRKPPGNWDPGESTGESAVRAVARTAQGGVRVARAGGHVARGLFCYFFAGIWGFAALASGVAMGSLPSLFGIGAMAAFMFWAGKRAFAKAREVAG